MKEYLGGNVVGIVPYDTTLPAAIKIIQVKLQEVSLDYVTVKSRENFFKIRYALAVNLSYGDIVG